MTEPEHANPTPTTQALVGALLAWYDKEKRNLPWREHCTPYRSLLSELMLQQTRVDTALPYFERFTSRWPTLSELAGATEEEVTAEWAGLGYYSRARNLLKTSRLALAMGSAACSSLSSSVLVQGPFFSLILLRRMFIKAFHASALVIFSWLMSRPFFLTYLLYLLIFVPNLP